VDKKKMDVQIVENQEIEELSPQSLHKSQKEKNCLSRSKIRVG